MCVASFSVERGSWCFVLICMVPCQHTFIAIVQCKHHQLSIKPDAKVPENVLPHPTSLQHITLYQQAECILSAAALMPLFP